MSIRAGFLFVIVPLVALADVAGTSSAVASCGDWLSHREERKSESSPAVAIQLGNYSNDRSPTTPCNGPNCRRAPSHPANPTTPAINPPGPESALLGNTAALRLYTLPDSLTSAVEVGPAKGFPSRIDHPPRS